jgi:hypothetical protein
MPELSFTPVAVAQLVKLAEDHGTSVQRKAVHKALGKLEENPRNHGLQTHKLKGMKCPHNGDLFEAYAQNRTPGAYRIFFCYMPPPDRDTIQIVAIVPHP